MGSVFVRSFGSWEKGVSGFRGGGPLIRIRKGENYKGTLLGRAETVGV